MGEQPAFGPYRILETLSKGPIADLCRAVHGESGSKALLRIVHPNMARNPGIRAVLDELRDPQSPRRIDDVGVLRILDVGGEGDRIYVACENFRGMPLNRYLSEHRPTVGEALMLATQIAASLRSVHDRRVVHGDIKPENILVAPAGKDRVVVKLAMADLATAASEATLSLYGEAVGTPKYMAPEQIDGRRATTASDIFALGIVFYEMFTGREPFSAEGPLSYLRANVEQTPEPPAMVESTVPPELSRVVERMLEKDPARRYRRADALLDDLERVETRLDGRTPATAPPGADSVFASDAAPAQTEGGPWRAVAIASLTMLVILFAAVVFLVADRMRSGERAGPFEPAPRQPVTDRGPAAQPDERGPAVETPAETESPPETGQPAELGGPKLAEGLDEISDQIQAGEIDTALSRLDDLQTRYTGPADRYRIMQLKAEACVARARSLQAAGHPSEAVEWYRRVVTEMPNTDMAAPAANEAARLLVSRANLQASRGHIKDATETLQEVLSDFPLAENASEAAKLLPEMRARYAEALLPTKPAEAVELLRAARAAATSREQTDRFSKRLADALIERARILQQEQRFAKAASDLDEAGRLDADLADALKEIEPEVLYQWTMARKAEGDYEGALTTWNLLRKKYPADKWLARGMREMSELTRLVGSKELANPEILLRLAEKRLDEGNRDAAREHLDLLVEKYRDSEPGQAAAKMLAEWKIASAMELWLQGRMEEGIAALREIAEKYPDTPGAERATVEIDRYDATPTGMAYVPGGPFIMGLTLADATRIERNYAIPKVIFEREVTAQILGREVNVKPFYMDRREVTNAEYLAYVTATDAAPPAAPTWDGGKVREGYEDYPVTNVTWNEAAAYAQWAGKRLPTEAEWEKVGRNADGRIFPWGSEFNPDLTVTSTRQPAPRSPAPVGSLPEGSSPYGVEDLVANVQEWTANIYVPYKAEAAAATVEEGNHRAVRGAGYHEIDAFSCMLTARWPVLPDTESTSIGFRCAADIPADTAPEPEE